MPGTQPARGTRDFLPADVRRRSYVVGVVRDVYERYGFEPLETPAFENIETLLGQYGEESSKLIFKILRRGEREEAGEADLALRYDLTVPLARVVAHHQGELPRFFKRYQIQPVWRADRPARGRFREFYQCDVDAIGSTSPVVEVEILSAVSDVLRRLGFTDFIVRLNDRRILTGVLDNVGIPASAHATALVAIDKFEHIGRDGVRNELVARGLAAETSDALLDALYPGDRQAHGDQHAPGADRVVLEQLTKRLASDGTAASGVETVTSILSLAAATSAGQHLRFDPSLARGLSYYTGAIMEIAVADLAGSLGGGGRYDNLVGSFLDRPIPACGLSLGLERLLVVMTERRMFPPSVEGGAADVMVTLWNEASRADLLRLAHELRSEGLRVDVYPEAEKLGKQFKYASSRQVPFVVIVGDEERAAERVAVKNMRTGDQRTVERRQAAGELRRALADLRT